MRRTPPARLRQYLWRALEVACLLALVALLCAVFVWTLKYTLPFVIGGFFAILLLPLVRYLEHLKIGRVKSVITVLAVVGAALIYGFTWTVIAVTREAVSWSANIPTYFRLVQDWIFRQAHTSLFSQLPPSIESQIDSAISNSLVTLRNLLTSLTRVLIRTVTHTPESLFVVVIAVLTTYFMLVRRDRMYARFLRMLPPGWDPKVRVVGRDILRAFAGTIRVQIILMLLSAVLGVLGLSILHIHYAVILGLLFGVTGLVPILGSALLSVPWAAGALLIGDVNLALKVILLQLCISVIRHMVEPKILADSVGLDTLSTLFSLYVGMKVLGVIGLFVGPIVLIGIKSLLRIRLFVDFLPEQAAMPYSSAAPDVGGTESTSASSPEDISPQSPSIEQNESAREDVKHDETGKNGNSDAGGSHQPGQ